nr:reverse transcriptase domain-containing protein [Tanacetum cinerariifolium]
MSRTMSTREHEKRHRSRRSRSPRPSLSVFSRIRREQSRSPTQKVKEKERGVFKRLGDRGKSASARSDSHNQRSYSRYTEAFSKSEDIRGGYWKSKSKKKRPSREEDDFHIKTYDGSEDPQDHLKISQAATKTERYNDLKKAFLENYLQQKKYIKDPIELHNIKQRDGESTKYFVRRYKLESRDVKGAPECIRISKFVHGITNPELIKRLHDKIPKTMDEMMRVTTSFLRGEVAASNHERKKSFPPWKQQKSNQKQNFRKRNFWNQQRPKRKQDQFTLLIKTPKEIFVLEKAKFKAPPPMTTPVEKRNHTKFCEFHGEETSVKDKALDIPMVQPWERVARQKITQSFSPNAEIFFPPLDEGEGTEGPMIIEAEIGGHCIHRMYVDGGSASEILYEHCFNRLRLKIKNQRVPAITLLIGFSGEIMWPIGQIQLLVRIGDEEHSALAWMNFVVVRSPSPYNGIIGRPGVRKLQAVPSTAQGMLKLSIEGGAKERGQAADRNQAIQEEVRKLVEADFKDLNQACPKDGYPLPEIGWKVESLCGFPFKCFLDAYKGYHQIQMTKEDEEKIAFITSQRIFCYTKMPFGLRNAGATYQRLVDKAFHKQISRNLKVYVDDLVINSRTKDEIVKDIKETFKTLREINMKLNPKKCTFWVEEGMFLGYKVNTKGLKVYPDKVDVILSLPSPKCLKDVQKLNRKLVSLNRFMAKSAEKSLPFFKTLKKCMKKSDFHWTTEAEEAFKKMKQLIAELPMLTAPMEKEELIVYLAAAKETVSAVLMTKRKAKQMPIYFVSRALRDFIVERPKEGSSDTLMEVEEELPDPWILFTDGSSCTDGSEAGLILTNPEGVEFTYALKFRFDATNNKAEYEALIAGLRIAKQMGVKNLQANVDSRLVANQANGTYVTKEVDMIRYLEK